jgi:hypothetical protein
MEHSQLDDVERLTAVEWMVARNNGLERIALQKAADEGIS